MAMSRDCRKTAIDQGRTIGSVTRLCTTSVSGGPWESAVFVRKPSVSLERTKRPVIHFGTTSGVFADDLDAGAFRILEDIELFDAHGDGANPRIGEAEVGDPLG